MNYGKYILTFGILGFLTACAPTHPSSVAVSNRTTLPSLPRGESMETINPVHVPSDMSSETIKNEYTIPSGAEQNSVATSLLPPGSGLQDNTSVNTYPEQSSSAPIPTPAEALAPAHAAAPQATAAQAAVAKQRTQGGNVGLSVKNNYNQTWKQVGKASSSAGYPVMEEDSSSGTYYILDKAGSGGVIKRDTPIYQLKVQKQGDNSTLITVSNAQNQPADPATTQRILSAVKSKLN